MTNPSTTRTQQERAEQTRERILVAATEAFSEHGMAGARTEQIAQAAGINKALIYYYYRSKEALYDAVLDAAARQVVAKHHGHDGCRSNSRGATGALCPESL